jgi:DNA recombination-dependent growth factor C
MSSQTRSSRSRSIDLPKPDTGLAEWTSKIKAMQRQVDADDEAEQRKLEEEIAASRLARMRRSQGSKTSSLDLCKCCSKFNHAWHDIFSFKICSSKS